MGTPTLSAAGSWGYVASGSITPSLAAHAVGDMLIARVAYKSSAIATCVASTATSGWQKIGEFHDGTTNSGNGTGSVAVAAFWKVATATTGEAPTIDFSQTVTQVGAEARAYALGSGDTAWLTPVGDGGGDTTANTSHSAAIQSHVSITAGDLVDFFTGIRDDTTMTVPTFTQADATLAAVVESPAAAGSDTSGADGAYDGGYRTVSSGTSSAAAVVTGTLSTSETGASWQTRLRSFASEDHEGTVVATGGGVAVLVAAKAASVAPTATGGGIVVLAAAKAATAALVLTGGGILTPTWATARTSAAILTGAGVAVLAQATARSSAISATGGGVAALVGEAAETHEGSLVATGGGIATLASATTRAGSAAATGGGIAVLAQTTARSGAPVATGGGVATLSVLSARAGAAAMSGGGVLVVDQATARSAALVATGGGVAILVGEASGGSEDHEGTVVATGGGVAILVGSKQAATVLSATGGGVIVPAWATARTVGLLATGGGTLVILGSSARSGVVLATGGGQMILVGEPPADRLPFSATRDVATVGALPAPTATVTAGAAARGIVGADEAWEAHLE